MPISESSPSRWLLATLLALAGLVALGALGSEAVAARMDLAVTWILSSELPAPGLVTLLAFTIYLQRRLHHKRRHVP